jgi:cyclic pyranopterin phosphate synthase
MFDSYQRRIHYLRISVTDRCNLRCTYCMPATGIVCRPHAEILTFEAIEDLVRVAVELGVDKVRLTGGEPLVRRDLPVLVGRLAAIPGLADLALTTNGVLLSRFARPLREAGLHRVNISLDTLDPERFAAITRGGAVAGVLAGIEAARSAGFRKIKLNCVITASPDEPDAQAVAGWARDRDLELRFIRRMDLAQGEFWPVIGGEGGRCASCNRLRVSSTGLIYPCLFSDLCYDSRTLGPRAALLAAVGNKPASGRQSRQHFCQIGG